MQTIGARRTIVLATAVLTALTPPVLAQDGVQTAVEMVVLQGTPDRPFTLIYPSVLQPVDDESEVTVATLRHPDAVMQCDAFVQDGAAPDWSAEAALQTLDTQAIVDIWTPDFPGFALSGQRLTSFQSGPALMFEGTSDNSPFGLPVHILHAEAADSGRFYVVECLVDASAANEARPMIEFIIANFSTRSDGVCCVDPADPRG